MTTTEAFGYDFDTKRRLLVVRGELDEVATLELRETINNLTGTLTADLAIDLGEVTFMPSPAIGVLAAARAGAERNGATISFVAPAGSMAARLLTICGLDYRTEVG